MPQIYNLGGLVVQKLAFLNLDRIKDSTGELSIMEINYDANSAHLMPYQFKTPVSVSYRNVEKIITKSGKVYIADNIQESGNQVSS